MFISRELLLGFMQSYFQYLLYYETSYTLNNAGVRAFLELKATGKQTLVLY
jgi:hypothetical protein